MGRHMPPVILVKNDLLRARAMAAPGLWQALQAAARPAGDSHAFRDAETLAAFRERWLAGEAIPTVTTGELIATDQNGAVVTDCAGCKDPKPMTWREAFAQFTKTINAWHKAGRPILDRAARRARVAICKSCDHYAGFRCMLCKCPILTASAVPQKTCPAGKWPPLTINQNKGN
jgi:hypothetical protein